MSPADQTGSASESRASAQDIPQQSTRSQHEFASATPVEMSSLPPDGVPSDRNPSSSQSGAAESDVPPRGPVRMDTHAALDQYLHPAVAPLPESEPLTEDTATAIGPSSQERQPDVPAKDTDEIERSLTVNLLLTSGARHPFRLDNKYLAKRNVEIPDNEILNLSVYKLKELILREWRDDWELKPSSPNYIRLIMLGKLLDDKAPIKDYAFGYKEPNILHMTIKPQDYVEDDDAKGGKSGYTANRETEGRSPGCRCIVM